MSVLGCYGVSPDKATEDWMCSRCTENALEEVKFFIRFSQMESTVAGNLATKLISIACCWCLFWVCGFGFFYSLP